MKGAMQFNSADDGIENIFGNSILYELPQNALNKDTNKQSIRKNFETNYNSNKTHGIIPKWRVQLNARYVKVETYY